MEHVYPHIISKVEDWPVAKISQNRSQFISELNVFVEERLSENFGDNLNELISKTIYLENQRIRSNPWKVDPADDRQYWKNIAEELEEIALRPDRKELELKILQRIINRYSEEIVGHFIPKTFQFSRIFLTSFFKRIFNSYFAKGKWRWGTKADLQNKIKLVGDVDKVRSLFKKGTVVVLPTHYSNLDSIMVGYAIDSNVGIPAFSYGAGLNLYNVEIIAYFMNRLGAFRVDRRKKNPIYLECLKSMSSYSLLQGVNSIFFPGGTRSRSGITEDKLKLGLLSSAIEAQRLNLVNNTDKKIFIVPLNLGYHFVLEAGFLVEQHLQSIAKEKYVRPKTKGWTLSRALKLAKALYTKDSEVFMSFGDPMDILGNKVDANGVSYDKFGHEVDLSDYFRLGDEYNTNSQRESVYTKLLGDAVVTAYRKNNVILSSNIISFAAWLIYFDENKDIELYTLLQSANIPLKIDKNFFSLVVAELVKLCVEMRNSDEMRLSPVVADGDIDSIISHGIKHLGLFHASAVLKWDDKNSLVTDNLKLLYFYHHRMVNYGLEEKLDIKLLSQKIN
ncbi:MAG: 1-acyl-sn-glycerol-3-phosphate acyltransferase [Saprospiraceae bacterium]|nr:1-acyl-sn-glycerol-3-phosphate acyltransferase [Saprospiraceae bacterium]